ncbi:MAG: C10 family peptidase [Alistipes sp.]|nr:C10 family peptidase [Alistipes sp.]
MGTQTQTLVHCNFGWNGTADGYYSPDQFNSFTGPTVREPDDPGGRGGTYYDQNIKILTYDNIPHL